MRAWVVEFASDAGFGRVRLDDGRTLGFDITRCKTLIPEIGAEVDVRIGDGPRGPRVIELVAVATPDLRELDGVLAIWGDVCNAICFSTEQNATVLVPFDRSAWQGEMEPAYGQTVRCLQPITRSLVAPGGWGHTMAVAVAPAEIPATVAATLRAALGAHGREPSFPGYRRAQHVMPLVMPASGVPAWKQDEDWPLCACGGTERRTKFLGHPQNGASLDDFVRDGGRFHENGVVSAAAACPLTAASGEAWEPEAWSDVACFACESCAARYFTFQST